MSDVLKRHLDAMAASLALLSAQIEAMRHALGEITPVDVLNRPESCRGVEADRCVHLSPEAGTRLMGGVVVCVGCQERLTPQ